jgi:hypothetical protein
VNLRAGLRINGQEVAYTLSGWDVTGDGMHSIVIPPYWANLLREVGAGPHAHVAVEVQITELPTVLELERRLRALEEQREPMPNVYDPAPAVLRPLG